MKHLLTKTNGSSIYKTKGAAKQAANRFLKANQGDYRQEVVEVDNGFEITMIELTVVKENQQALEDKIQQLEVEIANLKASKLKGDEALDALQKICDTYKTRALGIVQVSDATPETEEEWFLNLQEEHRYVANEIAYGQAREIIEGIDPLKTIASLIDMNLLIVTQDEDGYLAYQVPHSYSATSELVYGLRHHDLITEKMRMLAKLQPEKIVHVKNNEVEYDSGHTSGLIYMFPPKPVTLPEGYRAF